MHPGVIAGAPSLDPTLDADLTSSLPSSLTFARSGTRNAIVDGAIVSVATGTPAFESWDGVDRGMAVDASPSAGAISQLLTYSNTISNAAWSKVEVTTSTGDVGPDGVTGSLTALNETATTNTGHKLHRSGPFSSNAGTRQTAYYIIKPLSTGTRWAVSLRISNQYNNNGPRGIFFIDGTPGAYLVMPTSGITTDEKIGYRNLANGMILIWITATWVVTGNKEFELLTCKNDGTVSGSIFAAFDGVVTEGFQVYGGQVITGEAPTGWVATTTTAASQPAETAVFNTLSWFTSGQGTFIVEHDCTAGTLVGSGSTAVLSATAAGKTAFAWDSSGSDTVNNGGSASSGSAPTFGADIRLLGTSTTGNIGHIKSIKFYNRRLSVADMQAATAPAAPTSTATPGVLRTASVDNRINCGTIVTTSGTQLNFVGRFRLKMGADAMSSLKLAFGNFAFEAPTIGNSIVVDACYLERVTTVAESVQVMFGGSADVTLADGAVNILSDEIVPASFTGLSNFPGDTELWVRVRGHVASAGQKISTAARPVAITGGIFRTYDPATAVLTNFTGTGTLVFSGSGMSDQTTAGFCPILVGVPVAGDPKSVFIVGDSLVEGTNGNYNGKSGTYVRKALENLGVPSIEFSKGGTSQFTIQPVTHWYPYLAYCRVFVDMMGTNEGNRLLHFFKLWQTARVTYGYDKVGHIGTFPRSTSSDSWATEANQTVTNATYPAGGLYDLKTSSVGFGILDFSAVAQAVRGVDPRKWVVTGAANYATSDGTHQTTAADDLAVPEVQSLLDALEVT